MLAISQTRDPFELSFGDLREQVGAARAGLQRLGVGPGDRVVAYLPNIPETLVAFLATASLGAVWATCAPEFGPRSVIDRFGIVEPKVLLAIAGYRYGEKAIDRRAEVAGGPRRAARRSSTWSTCRTRAAPTTRCPTRSAGTTLLGRAGAARVRPGAVRPPALRALLVGHHRAAEGDRPPPRRHPDRALQEPRPELGPPARATA